MSVLHLIQYKLALILILAVYNPHAELEDSVIIPSAKTERALHPVNTATAELTTPSNTALSGAKASGQHGADVDPVMRVSGALEPENVRSGEIPRFCPESTRAVISGDPTIEKRMEMDPEVDTHLQAALKANGTLLAIKKEVIENTDKLKEIQVNLNAVDEALAESDIAKSRGTDSPPLFRLCRTDHTTARVLKADKEKYEQHIRNRQARGRYLRDMISDLAKTLEAEVCWIYDFCSSEYVPSFLTLSFANSEKPIAGSQ